MERGEEEKRSQHLTMDENIIQKKENTIQIIMNIYIYVCIYIFHIERNKMNRM